MHKTTIPINNIAKKAIKQLKCGHKSGDEWGVETFLVFFLSSFDQPSSFSSSKSVAAAQIDQTKVGRNRLRPRPRPLLLGMAVATPICWGAAGALDTPASLTPMSSSTTEAVEAETNRRQISLNPLGNLQRPCVPLEYERCRGNLPAV